MAKCPFALSGKKLTVAFRGVPPNIVVLRKYGCCLNLQILNNLNEIFSEKGAVRGIKGFEMDLMHILADKFAFKFKPKLESAWGVKLPGYFKGTVKRPPGISDSTPLFRSK